MLLGAIKNRIESRQREIKLGIPYNEQLVEGESC